MRCCRPKTAIEEKNEKTNNDIDLRRYPPTSDDIAAAILIAGKEVGPIIQKIEDEHGATALVGVLIRAADILSAFGVDDERLAQLARQGARLKERADGGGAMSRLLAALAVAALTPSAALAGGFTICNSLGGGSRVCTSTEDSGNLAIENSLGGGAFVGRDTNGGA